jgi:hypothetical protein
VEPAAVKDGQPLCEGLKLPLTCHAGGNLAKTAVTARRTRSSECSMSSSLSSFFAPGIDDATFLAPAVGWEADLGLTTGRCQSDAREC